MNGVKFAEDLIQIKKISDEGAASSAPTACGDLSLDVEEECG